MVFSIGVLLFSFVKPGHGVAFALKSEEFGFVALL